MADVKIQFSAHQGGHNPGDTAEVDAREARKLIGAGVAVPATKPAAKAAGVPVETAATAKE